MINNDTERFADYIMSQYFFTIFGVDGLGYVFTALYLLVPFLLNKK